MSRAQQFLNPLMGKSFLPTDISGLQLWLKADAGTYQDSGKTTPAVSDGDVVGAWADQSGNGNDVTQATTGNKPTLQNAAGDLINGLPVVFGDGTDDYLAAASLISGAQDRTAFIVMKDALVSGTGVMLNLGNLPDYGGDFAITREFAVRVNGGNRLWSTASSGSPEIFTVMLNGNNTSDLSAWLNGASLAVSSTGAYAINTKDPASVFARDDASLPFNGALGEVLVYSSALSVTDRQRVEQYLSSRWGITLS